MAKNRDGLYQRTRKDGSRGAWINDRLVRALARLLSHPLPSAPVPVLEKLRTELGTLEQNQFTLAIQHSTIARAN